MITQERQNSYLKLIDQLLRCPNGQEPEVLDAHLDLIDAEFIQTIVQVATAMAHENNPDASKFLMHVARQLAKQLELYPKLSTEE